MLPAARPRIAKLAKQVVGGGNGRKVAKMLSALNTLEEVVSLTIIPQSYNAGENLLTGHRTEMGLSYQRPSFLDYISQEYGWDRSDVIAVNGGGIAGKATWKGLMSSAMRSEQVLALPLWQDLLKNYVSVGGYMLLKDKSPIQKVLLESCQKVPDAAGYISRFQAALVEDGWFPNVKVVVKTPEIGGELLGSDGASWGWNINHPMWADTRKKYQEVPLQFTALGTEAFEGKRLLAKGMLVPIAGLATDPPVYIAPNVVKGAMKSSVKEGQEYVVNLGLMRADNAPKTQKLGYQWLENIPVTKESVGIACKLARQAVRKLAKTDPLEVGHALGKDNPDVEVLANLAEWMQVSPLQIPNLRELVLDKFSSRLWDAFAGLGMEGQVHTLIMDNRLKSGECVFRGKVGTKVSIVRSPQVHWQGCVAVTNVAPLPGHCVYEDKVMKNTIFMSLNDVARLNGDDDGDQVAVFSNNDVVRLTEIAQEILGNTIWSFEPSSSSVKETFEGGPGNKKFEEARKRLHIASQGPVGLAANARSWWLGFEGNQLPNGNAYSYALAATVLEQLCVDDLKKMTSTVHPKVLAELAKWVTENTQLKAPKPQGTGGYSSHEAVEMLLEIQAEHSKLVCEELGTKKFSPIAWKIQSDRKGNHLSKKIALDNFQPCGEKDGGWSTQYSDRHSLLHHSHDAACEEWSKAQVGLWDLSLPVLTTGDVLKKIEGFGVGIPQPSRSLIVEFANKVADKNRRLARYYTEKASWDGDDDGGKGALEAVKGFKAWCRKLNAGEMLGLAKFAIGEKAGNGEVTDQDAFLMLGLAGSEFSLQLGLDPAECKTFPVMVAMSIMRKFLTETDIDPKDLPTEAVEIFECGSAESELHAQFSDGVKLVDCPDCSMRLKQAVAELSRGHHAAIPTVRNLAETLPPSFAVWQAGKSKEGKPVAVCLSNEQAKAKLGKTVKFEWIKGWSQPILKLS